MPTDVMLLRKRCRRGAAPWRSGAALPGGAAPRSEDSPVMPFQANDATMLADLAPGGIPCDLRRRPYAGQLPRWRCPCIALRRRLAPDESGLPSTRRLRRRRDHRARQGKQGAHSIHCGRETSGRRMDCRSRPHPGTAAMPGRQGRRRSHPRHDATSRHDAAEAAVRASGHRALQSAQPAPGVRQRPARGQRRPRDRPTSRRTCQPADDRRGELQRRDFRSGAHRRRRRRT